MKTWTTLSYVFTFFDMTLQKNVKSRVFWILKKNVKNVFSNYGRNPHKRTSWKPVRNYSSQPGFPTSFQLVRLRGLRPIDTKRCH